MTKKRSSHGVMIMVEPVRLSALPSPPAPLHLDPSSLPGSCSSAQEQQQEMDRWSPAAPSRLSTRKQQRGRLPTGAYILIRAGTWARSKRGGFPHLFLWPSGRLQHTHCIRTGKCEHNTEIECLFVYSCCKRNMTIILVLIVIIVREWLGS